MKFIVATVVMVAIALVAGCERERRDFRTPPSAAKVVEGLRLSAITPGGGAVPASPANPYEDNAYAVSEGKRLFSDMNCTGCHADGGGGSGPALMDDVWAYGSEPANVFATIVQGRPNGMPSFGPRLTEQQVWQLVSYVRSMSGQLAKSVAPSRNEGLQTRPAENRTERASPRDAATPPAAQQP